MSDQRPDDGVNHGGRDPVETFFATHRSQVREEPADDLTWHRIREGRRREGVARRGAWVGGLVAAAAALAVVLGPSLLPEAAEPDLAAPVPSATDPVPGSPTLPADMQPTDQPTGSADPDEPTGSADPDEPTGSADPDQPTGSEGPGQPRTVTTPGVEGEIPAGSRFADVAVPAVEEGDDSGVRYAVLTHGCPDQGSCALLARSADGGVTWAPTADLRELGAVDQVTFADQARGWTWGAGGLWTTTDGGGTWTLTDVGPGTVRDVSVRGDVLVATTLTGGPGSCQGSDCGEGTGTVVVGDPTATDWSSFQRVDLGAVADLDLVTAGDQRYVVATADTMVISGLWRVDGARVESTASLVECGAGPVAVTAAQQDPQHLWALCDDVRGLAVQRSDTGARTWLPANRTVPSFVLGEQPPLAASTASDHLLLVGSGNYAVTTDGGQTWSTEDFLPGAGGRPDRLEVTVSGEILAYPTAAQASTELAYWRSGDAGATWDVVSPAG